jgi:hypothetical protein
MKNEDYIEKVILIKTKILIKLLKKVNLYLSFLLSAIIITFILIFIQNIEKKSVDYKTNIIDYETQFCLYIYIFLILF